MQHHFDVDLAKEYGLLEAVLLNHFAFWIAKNEAEKRNYHDGSYWSYYTLSAMLELFPYTTEKRLRNAISHLLKEEIIKTGNYNDKPFDHTTWYTITQKGKSILPKGQIDTAKRANRCAPQGKSILPKGQIFKTDNDTDNNTDNDTDNKAFASDAMNAAFSDWLQYKAEKRQAYKPTGKAQLISKLKTELQSRGETAVIQGIHDSMANGWAGIYFREQKQSQNKMNLYAPQGKPSYDLDHAEHKMNTTVPKLKKKENR